MEIFENNLCVINGQDLMELNLPPQSFTVRGLLPQGLSILGGAPKIGKSWMMLDLCIRVAKGDPLWGMATQQGTTLYLCLEDTLRRIQHRLNCITDEVPSNAYFATASGTLADDLEAQILQFIRDHPDTVLVVIDTFQMIRGNSNEPSYGGDYEEIQKLKRIADSQRVSLLLVHHLRKQGDRDPVNKLSGTTGITGAVDCVFVLDKSRRREDAATLVCTGRDIEHRELELRFSKNDFVWNLMADSAAESMGTMPKDMVSFVEFMKQIGTYSGGNTLLAQQFSTFSGLPATAKGLKQQMNKWRYRLEDFGVTFQSNDSKGSKNGQPGRTVDVWYRAMPTQTTQTTQVPVP